MAPKHRGELLIVGGGSCVLEDLEAYGKPAGDVMAINDVGMFLPKLAHWFSIHAEQFPAWSTVRKQHYKAEPIYHGKQGAEATCVEWPIRGEYGPLGGQSAILVGLALGYDTITLAGVPADDSGHFYPTHKRRGQPTDKDLSGSNAAFHRIKLIAGERVRSLSGNTKDIFGT